MLEHLEVLLRPRSKALCKVRVFPLAVRVVVILLYHEVELLLLWMDPVLLEELSDLKRPDLALAESVDPAKHVKEIEVGTESEVLARRLELPLQSYDTFQHRDKLDYDNPGFPNGLNVD